MPEISEKRTTKYTKDDEVAVFIAYRLNDDNAEAASRETGIPAPTIRKWTRKWELEGFSDGELQLIEKTAVETLSKASQAATIIIDRIIDIAGESTNLGQLVTAFDKMNAHIRLAQGKATVIREDRREESHTISESLRNYLE